MSTEYGMFTCTLYKFTCKGDIRIIVQFNTCTPSTTRHADLKLRTVQKYFIKLLSCM